MLNFKKLNHEQIVAMANGTRIQQEQAPVDKTKWFTAPEGLERFEIPKQEGVIRMDVLQFPLSGLMNKDLLDSGTFDTTGMLYWNQSVMVHECFPESIVCNKTFDVRKANNDVVCNECWEDKTIDFRRASKRYTLMLLRVHPNESLGITDYKFMYYLDTHGKFAKPLSEAWGKVSKRNDTKRMYFYELDELGCSLEVFFTKLKSPNGFEFWGTNDITFVKREDPLTQSDIDYVLGLNLTAGIHKPTEEEYTAFLDVFRSKAPRRDAPPAPPVQTSPVSEEPVAPVAKTYDEPPATVVKKDPVFEKPVADEAFGDKESEEDLWN